MRQTSVDIEFDDSDDSVTVDIDSKLTRMAQSRSTTVRMKVMMMAAVP